MRYISFLFLLIVTMSCSHAKKAERIPRTLIGTWIPVEQQIGDQALPAVVFEKQKLIVADSNYTMIAESVDKGIVKYNGHKMDIYGREGVNNGKHFTAIYKLENGLLNICYNLKGDSYPESFDTNGKPMFFRSVFKKAD